ncbi:hypothetical protein DESC_190075 [Desulfosarcina cetonica]|nr:hypothetical protein DESC_190075 [Desulfosarcina cetonica]
MRRVLQPQVRPDLQCLPRAGLLYARGWGLTGPPAAPAVRGLVYSNEAAAYDKRREAPFIIGLKS